MTNLVLIYDNDPSTAVDWRDTFNSSKAFSGNFHAEVMDRSSIEILEKRYEDFSSGIQWDYDDDLDKASILAIDFRLTPITTGENVAYLVRCFSRCQILIGVNQFGSNPFDLTLRGHIESYCDLNIGDKQLSNPGLWSKKWDGFRPWCWPVLPDHLSKSSMRIVEVLETLDTRIVDTLGIADEIDYLPRSTRGYLGATEVSATFRDFIMTSGIGLQAKDRKLYDPKNIDDEFIARVASARLSKWMERCVLPGQDIIVDAPHLVLRYPSLLLGDHSQTDNWDVTASFGELDDLSIDHPKIEAFRFKKDIWLSRPAWFWRGVSAHREIPEVSEPWNRKTTEFVFCEDTSRFSKRIDARQFFARVNSPYVRRWVGFRDFKSVEYEPQVDLVRLDESLGSETSE